MRTVERNHHEGVSGANVNTSFTTSDWGDSQLVSFVKRQSGCVFKSEICKSICGSMRADRVQSKVRD